MLKEAKSFLETEKNRLETEALELQDANKELRDGVEKDRGRIRELETVISATEDKVNYTHIFYPIR